MRIFIDSPLLIYLNASRSPELRAKYENFYLSLLSEHRAYLGVLVLDELINVSGRKYRVSKIVSEDRELDKIEGIDRIWLT